MRAYIIEVCKPGSSSFHAVSQEGYTTLEEAQRFVESRSDNPKQLSPMVYTGEKFNYFIDDILVRE